MSKDKNIRKISLEELHKSAEKHREENPEYYKKIDEKYAEIDRKIEEIITTLKATKTQAEELLNRINGNWGGDNGVYRFYHQSFKAYDLQEITKDIVEYMISLLNEFDYKDIDKTFMQIYNEGTYKQFTLEANQRWNYETRPIVEAFFHAKYFFEMLLKYGLNMDEKERSGQPGWASVLYFYGIR